MSPREHETAFWFSIALLISAIAIIVSLVVR